MSSVRGIEQIRDWVKVLESERSVNRNFIKSLKKERADIEMAWMEGMISGDEWDKARKKLDQELADTRGRISDLNLKIAKANMEIQELHYQDQIDEEDLDEEDRSDVPGWGEFG